MELWILMGTGTEKFVQEQSPDMSSSQYAFLNEMLLAGYTITDKQDSPLLSQSRTKRIALEDLDKATQGK